ncbi:MAG: type I-C CRISPR-associated protein Cas7/Csd2 [Verrucomicrobiales bacterium]|jgi:CRISPR-associated protein Csd2|nr:type I-C CRISPR-associated protein Cas7/Csd2 [Verrucomicrobiales bacterium]
MSIKNRYEFILLFDVQDGNPNGDPDAGNLPRLDPETACGLITDVCLKRKIRNYVQITKDGLKDYDIYVKEKAVLGRAHVEAFKELNIDVGQESRKLIPRELVEVTNEVNWPEGLSVFIQDADGDETMELVIASDADKKAIKEWLKSEEIVKKNKAFKKFIGDVLKDAKSRKPTADETKKGREWMCQRYFDIRTFGAVMSLKSAPNCGQVRGPVQLTFARSVDPIVTLEHSITRMAVATEEEAEKQQGDNRTMGRKHTVPYGLYVAHGFVSAHFAAQTGFSDADLELLWEALVNMFEHDHSAARGLMTTRKLIVFKHNSELGNARAQELFDRLTVKRKDESKPPRDYADYEVTLNENNMPEGVKVERK